MADAPKLDPKQAAMSVLMQGMENPDAFTEKNRDPNVAALMAQRDQELQGLIETKRKPQGLSSNVTGVIHALSGLAYLGGPAAGGAAMDRSRDYWQKAQAEEKEVEADNYNRSRNNYALLNDRIPKERAVDPMKAAQAVLGQLTTQEQMDETKRRNLANEAITKQGILAKAGQGANNPFTRALGGALGKQAGEEIGKVGKIDTQLSLIDAAIESAQKHKENSIKGVGTGPLATRLRGGTFNTDIATLEGQYRQLSLKELVATFSGLSKTIDTGPEREAFETAQPNIYFDDRKNIRVLLGQKSLALKAKAYAQGLQQWILEGGNPVAYQNNVGLFTTAVNPQSGDMQLVPKSEMGKYRAQGYVNVDEYANKLVGEHPSSTPHPKPTTQPQAAAPQVNPDTADEAALLQEIERLRKQGDLR